MASWTLTWTRLICIKNFTQPKQETVKIQMTRRLLILTLPNPRSEQKKKHYTLLETKWHKNFCCLSQPEKKTDSLNFWPDPALVGVASYSKQSLVTRLFFVISAAYKVPIEIKVRVKIKGSQWWGGLGYPHYLLSGGWIISFFKGKNLK